jgi:hypothetical protein
MVFVVVRPWPVTVIVVVATGVGWKLLAAAVVEAEAGAGTTEMTVAVPPAVVAGWVMANGDVTPPSVRVMVVVVPALMVGVGDPED